MKYTVQLFGRVGRDYPWTDDDTYKMLRDLEEFNRIADLEAMCAWSLVKEWFPGREFDLLTEAIIIADNLFDLFWETRNDNYLDEVENWGMVVAVFSNKDELGENPIYTRGSYKSSEAPWNTKTR